MESEHPKVAHQTSFTLRQSQATKIWLCMVGIVLGLLYFEAQRQVVKTDNYCLSTNSEAVGAALTVDHLHVGDILKDGTGLGGGIYRGQLTNGKHLIEIKKSGYRDFSQEIDIRREHFMPVNLQKVGGSGSG
jgi:hypothetical protein